MEDNRIDLVARLNVDDSAKEINTTDIPLLQGKLKPLEIKCNLDSGSISNIKSQLDSLKVDVGGVKIDDSAVGNTISQTVSAMREGISKGLNVKIPISKTALDDLKDGLASLFAESTKDSELSENITDSIDNITKSLDGLMVTITKIKPQFTQLAGETQKSLSSLNIQGLDQYGNIVNYLEKFDTDTNQSASKTVTVTQSLAKVQQEAKKVAAETKNAQKALNDFLKLEGRYAEYEKKFGGEESLGEQFKSISELMKEFDNTAPIDKQYETIIKVDNALKILKIDIDELNKSARTTKATTSEAIYPQIAVGKGTGTADVLSIAKNQLNDYFKAESIESEATRIKRAVEDTDGSLQRFYVQVERGDKSVETLTYALNEQGDAYEYLGKVIREADNSTEFRTKDISTQWDIQTEKLKAFIANAEKAGLSTTELAEDIERLQDKLASRGQNNEMKAFLDDFDVTKAKFQALTSVIRKDNSMAQFDNRVRTLSANMNAFAEANQRAIASTQKMSTGQTFADEWARLTSEMAKGANLSAQELRNLSADFRIFGREAEVAGLKGESAFGKFLNSFKTMSSYITANMVFSFVKRQLREMANEVIAVDTSMTELRKVTDATEAEFEKFGQSAAKTGRELGASISDVIEATATFARLGESLPDAEELGRVATLFKNVGDGITEEQAAEDLVSTMKAFKIEAKDSIEIIDKFNEVGKICCP